jgi:hypothetical protein
MSDEDARVLLSGHSQATAPNWTILGGGLAFVAFTLAMGISQIRYSQEIIFAGSMAIVVFLIVRLTRELTPDMR